MIGRVLAEAQRIAEARTALREGIEEARSQSDFHAAGEMSEFLAELGAAASSMPSEKTEGIIVRLVNWSETSCILTLLTKDFGLISAVAKGARTAQRTLRISLRPTSPLSHPVHSKSSDALDILTEAKLVRRFKSASSNLVRLNAGFYLAELTHSLLEPGQPFLELFELLAHSLYLLDQDQPIGPIVLQYELQLLRLLGTCLVLRIAHVVRRS